MPSLLNTDKDDAVTLSPGTRVERTDTHVHGVVRHGGTLLRRLVALDDGSTEYVHLDYLKASTEPIQDLDRHVDYAGPVDVVVTVPEGSNQSDLEAASETPDDDAPLIVELFDEVQLREWGQHSHWTRELVIERVREWAAKYGAPPVQADWDPGIARHQGNPGRAQRYIDDKPYWPSTAICKNRFGTWGKAIEAAGFDKPKSGGTRRKSASSPVAKPEGPHELDARAVVAEFEAQLEDDLEFQSPAGTVDEKWLAAMPLIELAIEPLTHDEAIHMAERHDAQAELFRAIARIKAAA